MQKVKYDVIVVGAGNAGLVFAKTAAKKGLSVLILERSDIKQLGHDWCDVIEKDVFNKIEMPPPPSDMYRETTIPPFACPDLSVVLKTEEAEPTPLSSIYIDRKRLIEWLLNEVSGEFRVDIRTRTEVLEPLRKNGRVIGVSIRQRGKHSKELIYANWVVDASGLRSIIASQISYSYPFQEDLLDPSDVFIAVKEILPEPNKDVPGVYKNLMLPGYASGFAWVMSYWENTIDVGIALPGHLASKRLNMLLKKLKERLGISGLKPIRKGGGSLPARRCRTRLIGDGYLIIGDAAWQVDPANGGGISSAMLAAYLAANAVAHAARNGSDDVGSLWAYQRDYFKLQGSDYAGLYMLRRSFQGLSEEDIRFMFKHRLITLNDFVITFAQGTLPEIKLFDSFTRAFRGCTRPDLLWKLMKTPIKAYKAKRLYQKIPENYDEREISEWEAGIHKFFSSIQ